MSYLSACMVPGFFSHTRAPHPPGFPLQQTLGHDNVAEEVVRAAEQLLLLEARPATGCAGFPYRWESGAGDAWERGATNAIAGCRTLIRLGCAAIVCGCAPFFSPEPGRYFK